MDEIKNNRALLVEDDQSIREVLEEYLSYMYIPYLSVNDGVEAIDLLKAHTFDLIITDFQMPNLDGLQLLSWCRINKVHVPVVFISANAENVSKEQVVLQDCCATILRKPFEMGKFEAVVSSSLERNHHVDCVHRK